MSRMQPQAARQVVAQSAVDSPELDINQVSLLHIMFPYIPYSIQEMVNSPYLTSYSLRLDDDEAE